MGVEYGQLVPSGRDSGSGNAGPGWSATFERTVQDLLAWATEYRVGLALALGGVLVLSLLLRRFVRG
jgi:hypothetical protein